ncbi:UNVERIFIED_CONTAM: hypothetical protein K2H54_030399 [Gekko kuhli]
MSVKVQGDFLRALQSEPFLINGSVAQPTHMNDRNISNSTAKPNDNQRVPTQFHSKWGFFSSSLSIWISQVRHKEIKLDSGARCGSFRMYGELDLASFC